MARIVTALFAGTLLLTSAACSDGPTSPSTGLQQGADDPIVQNQGSGGNVGKSVVEIALTASATFPSAKGKAKFTVKGGQRELEIEVEHLNRIAGRAVNFFVGGIQVGSGTVSALGQADLELNTRLGHRVPTSVTGKAVAARTTDGALIASGSF